MTAVGFVIDFVAIAAGASTHRPGCQHDASQSVDHFPGALPPLPRNGSDSRSDEGSENFGPGPRGRVSERDRETGLRRIKWAGLSLVRARRSWPSSGGRRRPRRRRCRPGRRRSNRDARLEGRLQRSGRDGPVEVMALALLWQTRRAWRRRQDRRFDPPALLLATVAPFEARKRQ